MNVTSIDIDGVERVRNDDEVARLATAASTAFCDDLEGLSPSEWEAATVCAPWTVADIARHVLGAVESQISMRETVRQQFIGVRRRSAFDGNVMDAFNALQVEERRHLDGPEVVRRLRASTPRAVESRLRRARFLGRLSVPLDSGGSSAQGIPDKLGMGDLFRVVYTRDTWLHRLDIADALGRTPSISGDADRRIVEDVIKEWADRHGRPFDLRLVGPYEARYVRGSGGPVIETDAARLCWILSGRADADIDGGAGELLSSRVVF
jgi:uncharacterized protein (TIGR03083 family)